MNKYLSVFYSSVKETGAFTVISFGISLFAVLLVNWSFISVLGLVLLVEGAGLMLVGGAMSFVTPSNARILSALIGSKKPTSPEEFTKINTRAALLSMTGVMLFVESLALAIAFR